jgi:predicted metal-dependent phosphoesterase TrpH
MNVDLHTHTYPASDCSRIPYRDYIQWCAANGVEAVALTNHGDVEDNRKLEGALAAEGVLLLHGTEISTLYGDFVVFSPDLDYLARFRALQDLPNAEDLRADAAIVWVHPGAGGGRSRSAYFNGIDRMVAHVVDGVEVFNGNWLGERYVTVAEQIAARLGVARTAGSDAHDVERLMTCYTELPDPVRSTADLVDAIKCGATIPRRRVEPSRRRRRLGIF